MSPVYEKLSDNSSQNSPHKTPPTVLYNSKLYLGITQIGIIKTQLVCTPILIIKGSVREKWKGV